MVEKMANESRALLKVRFNYPIFMYEAEKVGITATGEQDQNELYPNPSMPPEIDRSCLELYREFCLSPSTFGIQRDSRGL
jgi:type I restriction enzyme M protein